MIYAAMRTAHTKESRNFLLTGPAYAGTTTTTKLFNDALVQQTTTIDINHDEDDKRASDILAHHQPVAGTVVVVDGVRSAEQAEDFRNELLGRTCTVFVWADTLTRVMRYQETISDNTFSDRKQADAGVFDMLAEGEFDEYVVNDGNVVDTSSQVRDIVNGSSPVTVNTSSEAVGVE